MFWKHARSKPGPLPKKSNLSNIALKHSQDLFLILNFGENYLFMRHLTQARYVDPNFSVAAAAVRQGWVLHTEDRLRCLARAFHPPVHYFFFVSLFLLGGHPLPASPEQQTARQVLEQLYHSIGNYQVKMPAVEVVGSEELVAAYMPGKRVIFLEKKAFDVCRSFGRDSLSALAFLLGHELAHCFQEVGWATNFLAYGEVRQGSEAKERSADIQGAFGAALAGFQTRNIISPLIDRLYTAYALKGRIIQGYPPMADRQATAAEVAEMVHQLWQVYTAGNYLSALGHYSLAASSYEYILDFYLGKEIFNNLGVLYAKKAMTFSGKNIDPYLYPFELDTESRLATPRSDDLNPVEWLTRRQLLATARNYLDRAMQLDPQYINAYVNLLCVQSMEQQYGAVITSYESGKVERFLRKAKASGKEWADAKIAVGAAYALSGEDTPAHAASAQGLWQELKPYPNIQVRQLAAYNESVLLGKPTPAPLPMVCGLSSGSASNPAGPSPFSFLNEPGIALGDSREAELFWKKEDQSTTYVARWQGQPFLFQRVLSRKYAAPGNIRAGDTALALTNQAGEGAYQSIPAGRGYFLHFPACRLIFLVDPEGRIEEWAKYFN